MNTESQMGHGAIQIYPIHRKLRRAWRKLKNGNLIGKGIVQVDWNAGYDVRDQIGAITIKNQGTNDSCSGEASGYGIEIKRRLQNIKEGAISSKSFYAPIAYPGGGTTVNSLINQFSFHGANLEATVPSYDAYGNPLSESMMVEKSWETPALIQDALMRAGYTVYDVPNDIDSVAATIQQQGFVIIEIQGQNGHTPDWRSATPAVPTQDNPNPLWQHFLCLCGYKTIGGKKYCIALESMGIDWGDGGVQYISEDYFNSPYILDRLAFLYDNSLIPNPDNNSIGAEILLWFRQQFMLWKIA